MNKKKIKGMVDGLMLVLFLLAMAFHITGNFLHEWVGLLLFAAFLVHNALNWRWYRSLFKGKHTPARIFRTATNLLLAVAVIGTMVSGMMLSKEVFGSLDLSATALGRRLHMISASWAYVLMAVHMGFHLAAAGRAARDRIGSASIAIGAGILSVLGIYAAGTHQLWQKMFLRIEYAFFDFNRPAVFFFLDYIAIIVLFASIGYCGNLLLKRKRTGNEIPRFRKNRTDCQ